MITGNKGEWSEIYVLLKLLGDKKLFLGDKDLQRIKDIFYPILKIIRSESTGIFEYTLEDKFVVVSGGDSVLSIPIDDFKVKAEFLFEEIKSSNQTTFSVPEIEEFMESISCMSLKANSSTKTDITIKVHDQITNQNPILGFSIKSQLGRPSTLLNAGKTTNFTYQVIGNFTESDITRINEIKSSSKIMERIFAIEKEGGKFQFETIENNTFKNNLILIDSKLPDILAALLFDYYTSSNRNTVDLTESVSRDNPLGYDKSEEHSFYEYKVKRFLSDVALGMMPSKVWTGLYDATGGYLVVKEDGEVLCYHIYNRNQFEDYLFNNTKFETASSSRHNFGKLYIQKGNYYFKLNLQIRFTN